jgi:hypothetical protein
MNRLAGRCAWQQTTPPKRKESERIAFGASTNSIEVSARAAMGPAGGDFFTARTLHLSGVIRPNSDNADGPRQDQAQQLAETREFAKILPHVRLPRLLDHTVHRLLVERNRLADRLRYPFKAEVERNR